MKLALSPRLVFFDVSFFAMSFSACLFSQMSGAITPL